MGGAHESGTLWYWDWVWVQAQCSGTVESGALRGSAVLLPTIQLGSEQLS